MYIQPCISKAYDGGNFHTASTAIPDKCILYQERIVRRSANEVKEKQKLTFLTPAHNLCKIARPGETNVDTKITVAHLEREHQNIKNVDHVKTRLKVVSYMKPNTSCIIPAGTLAGTWSMFHCLSFTTSLPSCKKKVHKTGKGQEMPRKTTFCLLYKYESFFHTSPLLDFRSETRHLTR